jgi:hypothetical protein
MLEMKRPFPITRRFSWYRIPGAALLLALLVATYGLGDSREGALPQGGISGSVVADHGPVAGANVRIQGAKSYVTTDASGRVILLGLPAGRTVNITAWKHGYYCSLQKGITPPAKSVRLSLIRYQTKDNPGYAWVPPEGKGGCSGCHNPAIIEMSLRDAHLKSATNPRFLTMYYGADMEGNQSPRTRYGEGNAIWKNVQVPKPPDPSKPYYGPGYLLDFSINILSCTACHIPGASIRGDVDPNMVKGPDRYGVHCDFCHKVADVRINPVTRMPFPRFPGVHSMDIRRPFTDDPKRPQLFFGTFEDDNVPEEDTNLPLLKESRYCAPCHFGVFWSTVVYNSYGEWLASPYSDHKSGRAKTCQECHMPSPTLWKREKLINVAPGKGGVDRDPSAVHSHLMTIDEELLQNSITLTAYAKKEGGKVFVEVTLTNDKTGHHVPSDSPLRHLILLVDAKDSGGNPVKQEAGPVLPGWCGVGDPSKGYYAGLPGKAYAKLLREMWTDVFPAAAYWRHTTLVSDNRLAAFKSDTSSYSFLSPEKGDTGITVTLLYRRAYIELMKQKKWNVPDIMMARKHLILK